MNKRVPWNKGLTGLKIGFAVIPQPKKHWAKGLTKEDHPSIMKWAKHHEGKGNPIWKGGVSQSYLGRMAEEYKLRTGICSNCKIKRRTAVHHKDRNRKNNSKDNLIELCFHCHQEIHHLGKHRSDKTKIKMSRVKLGVKLSEKHKRSLKLSHRNCKCPRHQRK